MTLAGKPTGKSMLIVDTAKATGMKHEDAKHLARRIRSLLRGMSGYRNVKVTVSQYCN